MATLTKEASDLLRKIGEQHIDTPWPDTRGRRVLVAHGLIVGRPAKAGHRLRYGLTAKGREVLARAKATEGEG